MKKFFRALIVAAVAWSAAAFAGTYPGDYPIRMIVPFAGGTTTDLIARVMAEGLSKKLGQSVVVENRPGAGGSIGTDYVAKSRPDGYTITLGTVGTFSINPGLYSHLPYHASKDFAYLSMPGYTPTLLVVRPDSPFKSLKDLIAYAKAHPGKLSFGSAGNGTSGHLAGELLDSMAGVKMTHIPYKEGGQALTAVIGGQVDFMFYHPAAVMPYIKSGKLRALAASSAKRSEAAPDVPTVAESGYPGFDLTAWFMLAAPSGVDGAVRKTLEQSVAQMLEQPEIRGKLKTLGMEDIGNMAPAQLPGFVNAEIAKWSKVIKESNAHID